MYVTNVARCEAVFGYICCICCIIILCQYLQCYNRAYCVCVCVCVCVGLIGTARQIIVCGSFSHRMRNLASSSLEMSIK